MRRHLVHYNDEWKSCWMSLWNWRNIILLIYCSPLEIPWKFASKRVSSITIYIIKSNSFSFLPDSLTRWRRRLLIAVIGRTEVTNRLSCLQIVLITQPKWLSRSRITFLSEIHQLSTIELFRETNGSADEWLCTAYDSFKSTNLYRISENCLCEKRTSRTTREISSFSRWSSTHIWYTCLDELLSSLWWNLPTDGRLTWTRSF